jgi:hypothetical protein
MGVDHRGLYVTVAEQFLDRANVIAILDQVRRKGMSQNVRGGSLPDMSLTKSLRSGDLGR